MLSRKFGKGSLDLPMVGSPILSLPGEFAWRQEFTMITLNIPNMNCGGCARGVTAAIQQVDASANVDTNLQGRSVTVKSAASEAQLRQALTRAGFAPT
jgi:copper chaperone